MRAMLGMMKQMMGKGSQSGSGSGGQGANGKGGGKSQNANQSNPKKTPSRNIRKIPKLSGPAGGTLPAEFQSLIDAYNSEKK